MYLNLEYNYILYLLNCSIKFYFVRKVNLSVSTLFGNQVMLTCPLNRS